MDDARYKRILKTYLENDGNPTDEKLMEYQDIAKRLSKKTARHHYVPQHYIKGFVGNDGLLSVYDKERDLIKKNRVGPNGVFFEVDRNTMTFDDGLSISSIEDELLAKFDTEFAQCVRFFREAPIEMVVKNFDNQTDFDAFMINLFWRIPKTDFAFENLLDNAAIQFKDAETGEMYADEKQRVEYIAHDVTRKVERAKMFRVALLSIMEEIDMLPSPMVVKLSHFKNSVFVLGDYPIIYHKTPHAHIENLANNFFIPISSNRVYSRNTIDTGVFNEKEAIVVNALIIEQSKKMVCASNHQLLERAVNFYRQHRDGWLLLKYRQDLFKGEPIIGLPE